MNKEIKFGIPGGFPLTQDSLSFMQQQVQLIANGVGMAISIKENNDYLILDGCQKQNNAISPGIVSVKGEILPFAGGVVQNDVLLVETKQNDVFADGKIHEIYITRALTFGTGADAIPWSLFKCIAPAYDYIVDSDEKLALLHNNPKATSVLIRRGTWEATAMIELHENTRNIEGENGAILQFRGAGALQYPHDSMVPVDGCRLKNIRFRFIAANETSGGIAGFSGVSDCYFHIDSTNDEVENLIPLIGFCANIIGCTIKHTGDQRKYLMERCENVINSHFIGSPISCVRRNHQVSNCTFERLLYESNINTTNCRFYNSSVESCLKINNCHHIGAVANPYKMSYASSSINPEYACSDTPEGGFNSKSNY